MAKKIRFGIFGSGRGGYVIGNIYDSGAEVVAICDRRPAAIAQYKENFRSAVKQRNTVISILLSNTIWMLFCWLIISAIMPNMPFGPCVPVNMF